MTFLQRQLFLLFLGIFVASTSCLPLWAQGAWPRTVRDPWGTDLFMKKAPQAIVSLTLYTDEILLELVDHQRIKALEVFSIDPGVSNIVEIAKTFPHRLSGEKEQVIALKPDLVLVADWKERNFVQSLRDAGLSVFVMKSAVDFDGLFDNINLVGRLTGQEKQALILVNSLKKRLETVKKIVALIPPTNRLRVLSYSNFGGTYGRGTSLDSIITAAGLVNAATQAGLSGWPQISREQVLAMNPDIVLLPSWKYESKAEPLVFRAQFLADPIFRSLIAVRRGAVFVLPDAHLQSNSQYMVNGVEDLSRAAYPGYFR